jgi:hypothetical protein
MTLWLTAVMPTLCPAWTRLAIVCPPVNDLPVPGGPWIGQHGPAEAVGRAGEVACEGRLVVQVDNCNAAPNGGSAGGGGRRRSRSAARAKGPSVGQAVVSHVFGEGEQRVFEITLLLTTCSRNTAVGRKVRRVLLVLDHDPPVRRASTSDDRAEFGADALGPQGPRRAGGRQLLAHFDR